MELNKCHECKGSGKDPQSRASAMLEFKHHPEQFDADATLEEYMDDCHYCKGEGIVNPEEFNDNFCEGLNTINDARK